MKKISILLVLVMALSLCACGGKQDDLAKKTENVISVESAISELEDSSTLTKINEVYQMYQALNYDEKDSVENISKLKEFINVDTGAFTLSATYLSEIKAEESLLSRTIPAYCGLYFRKMGQNYRFSDFTITNQRQTDQYSYTYFGVVHAQDDYGKNYKQNVSVVYTVIIDAEEAKGYALDWDVNFVD